MSRLPNEYSIAYLKAKPGLLYEILSLRGECIHLTHLGRHVGTIVPNHWDLSSAERDIPEPTLPAMAHTTPQNHVAPAPIHVPMDYSADIAEMTDEEQERRLQALMDECK